MAAFSSLAAAKLKGLRKHSSHQLPFQVGSQLSNWGVRGKETEAEIGIKTQSELSGTLEMPVLPVYAAEKLFLLSAS